MSSEDSEIFREKEKDIWSKDRHVYNDDDIDNMKRYFKVEDDHDALLRYIKGNRIAHER